MRNRQDQDDLVNITTKEDNTTEPDEIIIKP